MQLPEGLIAVVKQDCPTCVLVDPVLQSIEGSGLALTVYVQDELDFPSTGRVVDDRSLEASYRLHIETVPTLIKVEGGREQARVVGWERDEWRALTGLAGLGGELPVYRPGCGSLSVLPGIAERLAIKYGDFHLRSRALEVPTLSDDIEYCFERGWSDGLPVVPPTAERVYRMLQATTRDADEELGRMPSLLTACTVEKVAINAVMAGCKPEYLPAVLAAVEAALDPAFCLHGLLATTWFSGPMVIVNGPARKAMGMNWAGNVLGQGNRANASIGRALQLTVRNVGGGKPQETDISTFGHPGKLAMCLAEDEEQSPWEPLHVSLGHALDDSVLTVVGTEGPHSVMSVTDADDPDTVDRLIRSLAVAVGSLAANNAHFHRGTAVIALNPDHAGVFGAAGLSRADVQQRLWKASHHSRSTLRTYNPSFAGRGNDDDLFPSVRTPQDLLLLVAGGGGLYSTVFPSWGAGSHGNIAITELIDLGQACEIPLRG